VLSIVLPTFNEAQNLPELLKRIASVLKKGEYEVIVVDDDSPDRTWEVAQKLEKNHPLRVLRRVGRRGLSSAVVEGFDAAKGDVLLVMDSDLQHDPALVVTLADAVESGADIAVASRYMKGGSVGEWVRGRRLLSKTATWLTRKIPAVEVSDPMSGFFALKKSVYQRIRPMLRPTGFKILFEILGHLPRGTKTAEVPLVFQMRLHGESKLSLRVELEFLWQLARIALMRTQKMLFWTVCIVIAIALTFKAISLLPLYADAATRSNVQHTLEMVTERNGWLLSDITLLKVRQDHVFFAYQPHLRGRDPAPVCFAFVFANLGLHRLPCLHD
jgi:dolichol-phosphate mannosyltransferase